MVGVKRGEYLSKLAHYKKVDETYRKKYGMTFQEFESRNIVAKQGYTWEVESDSQEWETAIDGIETILAETEKKNEINLSPTDRNKPTDYKIL